jgi:hypothetical protein
VDIRPPSDLVDSATSLRQRLSDPRGMWAAVLAAVGCIKLVVGAQSLGQYVLAGALVAAALGGFVAYRPSIQRLRLTATDGNIALRRALSGWHTFSPGTVAQLREIRLRVPLGRSLEYFLFLAPDGRCLAKVRADVWKVEDVARIARAGRVSLARDVAAMSRRELSQRYPRSFASEGRQALATLCVIAAIIGIIVVFGQR